MAKRDGITPVVSDRTSKTSYRARVSWLDGDGVRHHRSKSFRTRREAEQWRRRTLSELDRGDFFEPAPDTVAEVAERWLITVERARAASTYRKYREVWINRVEPKFGARKMASLRATEIQSWYDDLATLYAANTVAMVHKVLRGIASHAVTDGVIRANPCDGRRKPKDMEKPPVAWDATEARAFLSGVSTDDSAIPLILMLATGMRIGEALALHWRDVDFDARTVRVTHTLQDSTKGVKVVEATKASSSHRTVSLPAVAVLALRRQRELSTGSLVFTYPDGRPLGADSVRRKLTAACKRLNLRRLTPHGLRRTAVTLMLMRGVHPNVVSRQTGHTVELMLRRYAAVSSELQQQAASVLDDVFDAPQKRTP